MENFTHIIGNLEDLVRFKSLSLRGDWFLVNVRAYRFINNRILTRLLVFSPSLLRR